MNGKVNDRGVIVFGNEYPVAKVIERRGSSIGLFFTQKELREIFGLELGDYVWVDMAKRRRPEEVRE